jgi:NAD(P)-dependent dehydrogenase (short-subunit alcohol dehydrogenase family)
VAGSTQSEIPSQLGRTAVVTGATGGLGYETALALASVGADIILTGRYNPKGQSAVEKISRDVPGARVSYEHLDLASVASVADFAQRMGVRQSLDLLINNAGVMALPCRQVTADGFEMQFATNYLGRFALTARLLPLLRRASGPRVVSVSSLAHRTGFIDFDDLQGARAYGPWKAYGQSKLAYLMFALELQRRSDAAAGICEVSRPIRDLPEPGCSRAVRVVFFRLRPIWRRRSSAIPRRRAPGRSCSRRRARRQSRAPITGPGELANCGARLRPH